MDHLHGFESCVVLRTKRVVDTKTFHHDGELVRFTDPSADHEEQADALIAVRRCTRS